MCNNQDTNEWPKKQNNTRWERDSSSSAQLQEGIFRLCLLLMKVYFILFYEDSGDVVEKVGLCGLQMIPEE